MKKVLLMAVMAMFFMCASAQTNDSPKMNYEYCEIIGNKAFMASKLKIVIDYGNETEPESTNYKSMAATLNYMSKSGWELVQAYTAPVNNGNNMFYCWVLRREIRK